MEKINKEGLKRKIEIDLKCDKIMRIVLGGNVVAAIIGFALGIISLIWVFAHGIHFLLWYNAYLITQRDLDILEAK